ncbi:formate dehydrogenase accessory sulfurtransferase FdhD [Alkalicoccobacillus gibsonii]|jgi:FdhD protein|uniref:Sulfur carrier protein FdhD n=1 Tax=Alkalicoccobacillus gibsonii TaxID=79881 RepID=A0ABU9VJH5_9BACI|nr:formate dehydrogenase accessory sulfurtransferase FdhD [Alkalicoccobacillus gibsonii]MBM0065367.1 formate dehydrogenase accessory sulfurtransferase FdhD [Alkalicoccobacillus gibsonii]
MEPEITASRAIVRYTKGKPQHVRDLIVSEYALTIKVNGSELVTMVCTPDHIEDLVVGYLLSEGLIRRYSDIKRMRIDWKQGFAYVESDRVNPLFSDLKQKRYVTSCCGGSREGFVFAQDALLTKQLNKQTVHLSPDDCMAFMNQLQESADTFKQTGGVHNTALCNTQGMLINRMDIGRHNALDKLYGYCVRHQLPLTGTFLVFSGRISSEILLKAAKIGCEVLLSKSAPTERAIELAEQLGITTVGFIRNQSFNVYTCPERIG